MSNFPKVSSPMRQGWIQTQAVGSRGPHFSPLYHIASLEGGCLETSGTACLYPALGRQSSTGVKCTYLGVKKFHLLILDPPFSGEAGSGKRLPSLLPPSESWLVKKLRFKGLRYLK